MKVVAGIGSRKTPENVLQTMYNIGFVLASMGWVMRSGNAIGADQAFASGVNAVDPTLMHIWLPWRNYEKDSLVEGNKIFYPTNLMIHDAAKRHPAGSQLSQGVRRLMGRNMGIIRNQGINVKKVYCYQDTNLNRGGTLHGMNYARSLGIPVANLFLKEELERVQKAIARWKANNG